MIPPDGFGDSRLSQSRFLTMMIASVRSAAVWVSYPIARRIDRDGTDDDRNGYRVPLEARVAGLAICIGTGWILIGTLLEGSVRWPPSCHATGLGFLSFIGELWCSPHLLLAGLREYALFLWLWSLPTYLVVRRGLMPWLRKRKKRQHPIDQPLL